METVKVARRHLKRISTQRGRKEGRFSCSNSISSASGNLALLKPEQRPQAWGLRHGREMRGTTKLSRLGRFLISNSKPELSRKVGDISRICNALTVGISAPTLSQRVNLQTSLVLRNKWYKMGRRPKGEFYLHEECMQILLQERRQRLGCKFPSQLMDGMRSALSANQTYTLSDSDPQKVRSILLMHKVTLPRSHWAARLCYGPS